MPRTDRLLPRRARATRKTPRVPSPRRRRRDHRLQSPALRRKDRPPGRGSMRPRTDPHPRGRGSMRPRTDPRSRGRGSTQPRTDPRRPSPARRRRTSGSPLLRDCLRRTNRHPPRGSTPRPRRDRRPPPAPATATRRSRSRPRPARGRRRSRRALGSRTSRASADDLTRRRVLTRGDPRASGKPSGSIDSNSFSRRHTRAP